MRQGELLALRWVDLHFGGRFVAVNQTLVRGILTTPKNHQRRHVDMSGQRFTTLAALRVRQRARALKTGKKSPEMVFPSADRTYLDEANVRHVFYRILEKAKLRRICFHDLRHRFASLLIQQGESLAYVKDQLGRKSISITCDVDGLLVPGGNRAGGRSTRRCATICNPRATGGGCRGRSQTVKCFRSSGEPGGNRTHNPQIKSLLLCQLSYRPRGVLGMLGARKSRRGKM